MYISFYKLGIRNTFIKEWPNWTGEVPQNGDLVLLHFGDNNEQEEEYRVVARCIDGTNPDRVKVIMEPIRIAATRPTPEDIEELRQMFKEQQEK